MATAIGPLLATQTSGTLADQITFLQGTSRCHVRINKPRRKTLTDSQRAMRSFYRHASLWWSEWAPFYGQEWAAVAQKNNTYPLAEYRRNGTNHLSRNLGPPIRPGYLTTPPLPIPINFTATGGYKSIKFTWDYTLPFAPIAIIINRGGIVIVPARNNLWYVMRAANKSIIVPNVPPGSYHFNSRFSGAFGDTGLPSPTSSTTVS